MRKLAQAGLILSTAIFAALMCFLAVDLLFPGHAWWLPQIYTFLASHLGGRVLLFVLIAWGLSMAIMVFFYALLSSHFRQLQVKRNDLGQIRIASEALENIALNAARAAQAGVKHAKARVQETRSGALDVKLLAVLFLDVEIPSQMARIQDRIKKDLERYTGLSVASVEVRVSSVERLSSNVESGLGR